jgi:hypothetical protein
MLGSAVTEFQQICAIKNILQPLQLTPCGLKLRLAFGSIGPQFKYQHHQEHASFNLIPSPRPHFYEGKSKHQSINNVTLTVFNKEIHTAKVKIKKKTLCYLVLS